MTTKERYESLLARVPPSVVQRVSYQMSYKPGTEPMGRTDDPEPPAKPKEWRLTAQQICELSEYVSIRIFPFWGYE